MPRFRETVESSLPPEEAFARLAAFERVAEWDPGVVSARRLDDGPVRVGARYDVVVRLGGGEQALTYVVTALDPPRSIELAADGPRFSIVDAIAVHPSATGSSVTYDTRLRMKGLFRLAAPLAGRALRRIGAEAMVGMRRFLAA